MDSTDCIFCKIINGELPSNKVYEDSKVLAFLNIKALHPGHTLLITKKHYENIYEVPDDTVAHLGIITKKISIALKGAVDADGINIGMNNGPAAGQIVFHTHIHIMPRYNNDGLISWPMKDLPNNEAKPIAEKIRNEFKK